MRNLKRALSLALAAVMVLSMMVVGAGAVNLDDFSDKDEIVNKEAVTVLSTLNVINGKDDGSYDPTGIVTRAEMSKIICVILNGGKDPALGASTTHTYTDTVNHWAESYIEYCTQLGIVAGKGNGTFDPNGTVTATEAAKMLLVALGYNAGFEGMVGANWAISTNVLANQNKLYGGLDIDVDAGLTRDNAAQMAYNALNCEMVKYDYALVTGPNGSLTSVPRVDKLDDTLLSDKFGGVRVEGVVVRNEQTSSNFDGKTVIEITNADELTKVGHNFGSSATFKVATDASLQGTSVFFYAVPSVASPNNSEKAMVLGSVMDSGKNTVVSTTSAFDKDAAIANSNTAAVMKDYMDGEDITVNNSTVAVVNGAVQGREDDEATNTYLARVLANYVGYETKFIDNDNDGITEYVVQTQYGFGKITKYSTKDDGSLTIDTYTDSKNYKAEKIMGFEDVALDDYVVYNTMGSKLYVAKAETVTGTLETFKAHDNRLKANLTVDGTTYTFDNVLYDNDGKLMKPTEYTKNNAMGNEVTLYLDKFGYVVATSEVKAFTDYAYVANVQGNNDATAMAGSVRAYVILPDGTEASYVVNEFNNSDSFEDTEITTGAVYGYYITSDDKINLTSTGITNTAIGTENKVVEYKSGDATLYVDDAAFATKVDSTTTFFYAILKDDNKTVKTVEVYAGKNAAPSFKVTVGDGTESKAAVSYVDYDEDGVAEAVIVTTKAVTSSNILYLYSYVKSTGENAIYNAVIDGELVEGITVDDKATGLAGAVYTYTITSKGVYQLTKVTDNIITDFVTLVDGKSVVVGGKEVKLTDSTSMAEIDGSDTAIISSVSKKDYVTVVYNANNEAVGLYIIERYATDNASILAVDGTTVTDEDGLATTETTSATVLSALTVSKSVVEGTMKIVAEKPANYEAAEAAEAVETLEAGNFYYIVLFAEDGASYSATKLAVTEE
ncbi:S-layer homology domain-containing protein [Intestinimonas timonensis]|uniref:S-layer homology domain-containing protein n=1 Tax=Intestinimonas timonensis TaxID=1689270 RepID=UPI0010304CB0|nr:S-layer homology domain-containing protein [Intestinimonas timonensis]